MKPSVGRIVHYVSYGTPNGEYKSECRAAVITEVQGPITAVGLCVLNPTGVFFNPTVLQSEEKAPGSWHWPEREEPTITVADVDVPPNTSWVSVQTATATATVPIDVIYAPMQGSFTINQHRREVQDRWNS